MDGMVLWALQAALAAPIEPWLDAVLLVQQGSTSCAGVHVGGGRIATAYHCVASGGRPLLTTRDGARVASRVRSVSPRLDLALLDAPALAQRKSLPLALSAPALGARVTALGHPLSTQPPSGLLEGTLRWSAGEGVVSAVGPRALQVTAPLNPGNSGGPLVDERGEVVGIASRRLTADNIGFASRADQLPELDSEPRRPSWLGGTAAVHALLLTQTGGGGLLAAGARLELADRDLLVLDGAGYVPFSPRFSAARFGEAASVVAEGRAGVRLRLGRGPWAARLDALGGLCAVQRFTAPPDDPWQVRSEVQPGWLAAAQVQVGVAGLELGWMPEQEISRASLILRWPGVLRVF
jgi:hypothetical protein